jgi:hypothetical protein
MRGVERYAGARRAFGLACLIAASAALAPGAAFAQTTIEGPPPSPSQYGWRELYGGVDAARDQWLAYSGMTIAPFSRDIYANGWRFRFGGGYGQYRNQWAAPRTNCANGIFGDSNYTERCESNDPGKHRHSNVSHSYAEALLGYYLQLGRLTAKAFAGASMSSEKHLKAADPSQDTDGTEFGVKGALELWLDLDENAWTSLDLSYSTARNESAARWRTGWRVTRAISIGPELRYDKNIETGDGAWNGRAGLFTRYEWTEGEVSLAGGAVWWVDDWQPQNPSAYGSVNVLFRY